MDALSVFRPQRAVSTRELTRRMAHVLDEIEETGLAVTVVRYGRAVAVLAPLEGERVGRASTWTPSQPPFIEESESEDVELTETQEELIHAISAEPSREWSANSPLLGRTVSERMIAASRLELDGLAERVGGRLRLTRKGERLAQTLGDQVSVRRAAEREG